MKRCAIYARYSSELQSPSSIEDQLTFCRAHAERLGWTVVAVFHDAALSGFGVTQRPGYQDLLAAAAIKPPAFDIILVEDVSRLSRDIVEILALSRRLALAGIELHGISDGIATGQQGAKTLLMFRGMTNELYLDDLREKTHRGLAGRIAQGLSAGGRTFGYRSVRLDGAAQTSARIEIEPAEAEIVRRIFGDYAAGHSLKTIAYRLNQDRVPFPAKDTKRGPMRQGWAVSTVRVILRNEKYRGLWIWNKTKFLKDPQSGKRRPIPRPPEEWTRQERPYLRIIPENLWGAVQARVETLEERYQCGKGQRPRGAAHIAYSPHLLSGLLRCGVCGARMVAQTATRPKNGAVYRYGWYRCGHAATKGPAICRHRTLYRRDRLEASLLDRFRAAMTSGMIEEVTQQVNAGLAEAFAGQEGQGDALRAEILCLESQAKNLVQFLAEGGDSSTVREQLRSIEQSLAPLRAEARALDGHPKVVACPTIHPAWIRAKLEHLANLVQQDPIQAKAQIAKHLDGDLTISPQPSRVGEKRAEITGRVKQNSLLSDQEAVCVQMVAGAGFEPATFGL